MAEEFRECFLTKLLKLYDQPEDKPPLVFTGELAPYADREYFVRFLDRLSQKKWVVNVQPPPANCAGPEAALRYLSRYISGAVIHDSRLLTDDERRVTFTAKDYRRGKERYTVKVER